MNQFRIIWGVVASLLALVAVPHMAQAASEGDKSGLKSAKPTKNGDVYPLDTCAANGMKLGSMGKPFVFQHEGREVRFCCKGCVPKFEKDPGKYISQVDEKITAMQLESYPAKHDIVTDEPFAEGVEPVKKVYQNRLFLFSGEDSWKRFLEEPRRYQEALDRIVAEQQVPVYPVDICMIMDELLVEEEIIDLVHANRVFRLCCKACVKEFRKKPLKYHAMLDGLEKFGNSPEQ